MKQTAIDALLKQVESGKIINDKARILSFIKDNSGFSCIHIAGSLNMNRRTVTARLSDLEDAGLIMAQGTKTVNNTKHTAYSFVYAEEIREKIRKKRKAESYLRALKKLYSFESKDDIEQSSFKWILEARIVRVQIVINNIII